VRNSNKVTVLHRHVEALFNERVYRVNVTARAKDWRSAARMIETLHALLLESLLSTVKYNSHLLVAPLLVESLWS
jgi:uncharacterized Fe-S cluster-containing radical SAM superfamily enzyme